ncbi:MAG: hypothetical protein HFI84_02680 [Eubacterium sp.]|nr:hypothetical protein [Eubacterium sp.]
MNNEKALNKIYSNIDSLIDNYSDLPETKKAEERFWEYARKNILQGSKAVKERELESALYDVAYFNEKQGFIYGFNYALELIGKPDLED